MYIFGLLILLANEFAAAADYSRVITFSDM